MPVTRTLDQFQRGLLRAHVWYSFVQRRCVMHCITAQNLCRMQEPQGTRYGKQYRACSYYITRLRMSAGAFRSVCR